MVTQDNGSEDAENSDRSLKPPVSLRRKAGEAACTSRGASMSEQKPQGFTAAKAPEQRCWC